MDGVETRTSVFGTCPDFPDISKFQSRRGVLSFKLGDFHDFRTGKGLSALT